MPAYPTHDQTYKDLITLQRLTENCRHAMRENNIIRASNSAQMLAPLGERIVTELNRRRDHALRREGHG